MFYARVCGAKNQMLDNLAVTPLLPWLCPCFPYAPQKHLRTGIAFFLPVSVTFFQAKACVKDWTSRFHIRRKNRVDLLKLFLSIIIFTECFSVLSKILNSINSLCQTIMEHSRLGIISGCG